MISTKWCKYVISARLLVACTLPVSFSTAKDLVGKKILLKNEYCWTVTPGTTRVRHMCLQYCDGRTWKDKEGVGC
jgi:hypothetical protein